jgi:hypothetical protein
MAWDLIDYAHKKTLIFIFIFFIMKSPYMFVAMIA